MYYVYVLLSQSTHDLYKGSCADLKKRYAQHNSGLVKSTKSSVPWSLIYFEGFTNKTDALKEELFLKSGKGRTRLKYLLENTINFGSVA